MPILGITIDGMMRNKVGVIPEKRVMSSISAHLPGKNVFLSDNENENINIVQ